MRLHPLVAFTAKGEEERINRIKRLRRGTKILCLSDWRTQPIECLVDFLDDLPTKPDFIFYAGDDNERFGDFQELAERANIAVAGVVGNDNLPDFRFKFGVSRCIDLHRIPIVTENGWGIIGLEGSPKPIGFILYEERDARAHLERQFARVMREGARKVIVVSHAPPRGMLDLSIRFADERGVDHIGSTALASFIKQHSSKIPLVVCGHSHLNGGKHQIVKQTLIINVSSHDDRSSPGNVATLLLTESIPKLSWHRLNTASYDFHRLYQCGYRRDRALRNHGFTKLDDIVDSNLKRLKAVPGIWGSLADRWIEQADCIRSGVIRVKNLPEVAPFTTSHTLFYDIETDLGPSKVWLIGVLDEENGEFRHFFEKRSEKKLLRNFSAFLDTRPEHLLVSYSGTSFDSRVLVGRARAHGFPRLASRMEADRDFCPVARKTFVGNTISYKLKELARQLGYSFRKGDLDGLAVGMMYSEYRYSGNEPKWSDLLIYNEDDVRALRHLVKRALVPGEVPTPVSESIGPVPAAWHDRGKTTEG